MKIKLRETKNMKMKRVWLAAMVVGVLGAGRVWAADSDDVALSVTVSNSVSVLLPTAAYNFGSVALEGVSINTSVIEVNNNSGGMREDYSLSMVDAGGDVWGASDRATGVAGADTYVIQAMFKSAAPGHADFAADDNLGAGEAIVGASANNFALNAEAATSKGFDVTDTLLTHERTLWLRLQMPTSQTGSPADPFATIWVSAAAG